MTEGATFTLQYPQALKSENFLRKPGIWTEE